MHHDNTATPQPSLTSRFYSFRDGVPILLHALLLLHIASPLFLGSLAATYVLDISDDEGKSKMDGRGKENIPPVELDVPGLDPIPCLLRGVELT